MKDTEGKKVPTKTLRFSTLDVSKRTGKETASRTAMTLGLEAIKGPGGMLVLKIVDLCLLIRSWKNLSWP